MTEADEAIERLTAQLNHLVSLESVGVMVKTTDLAAVLARAARVAELELFVAQIAHRFMPKRMPLGYLRSMCFSESSQARALLKEDDQ
jgi:hypothetical protein